MAYEFLKDLFGQNEDGTPKAMTADQLEAAITAKKEIKVVDLASGGYVDQQKFDRVNDKLTTVEGQLKDANKTIQSYKDMDIDGIKASVDEWKTKAEGLDQKLAEQERDFAVRSFLGTYQFSDELAAEGVRARFAAQNFKYADGKFEGAETFMNALKQSNPGAFKQEQPAKQQPQFTGNNGGNPPAAGERKMSLTEIMEYANKNPGTNIDALMQKLG